jgi:hypothetical protein
MTPTEINERLALALGWRRSEPYPEYWVKPGDPMPTAETGLMYDMPDYLSGDGMLALLEEMTRRGYAYAIWDVPPISSIMRGPVVVFRKGVHPPRREDAGEEDSFCGYGTTLPEQAATAALRALTGDRSMLLEEKADG